MGVVLLFLYQAIDNLSRSNEFYLKQEKDITKKNIVLRTLYNDILEARSMQTLDLNAKNYSILSLTTKNSLYATPYPYVIWVVLKGENKLVRLESPDRIVLPLQSDNLLRIRGDEMQVDCEIFKITKTSKNSVLLYVKQKNEKPLIYQIYKEF